MVLPHTWAFHHSVLAALLLEAFDVFCSLQNVLPHVVELLDQVVDVVGEGPKLFWALTQ